MTLTIGEITSALQRTPPDLPVYFDFAGCVPTYVSSWRGVYAEPAIGWEVASRYPNPTVAQFLKTLEYALSLPHCGWKGGEFTYTTDSPLHVDNPGECTNTDIIGVVIDEYEVILKTAKSGT